MNTAPTCDSIAVPLIQDECSRPIPMHVLGRSSQNTSNQVTSFPSSTLHNFFLLELGIDNVKSFDAKALGC